MKTRLTLAVLALLSTLNFQPSIAHAQGTAFTYQGRVTDNSTNFTGTGQFEFALVTGTNTSQQATATANPPSGGFITIINVIFGGSGYVSAPAVTITGGGGTGAMATASISASGVVTNITVNNPGSGYTSTPTVTVAPPPPNIAYTTWWSNDGTSIAGSEPTAAVSVNVANGLFTVTLGNTNLPNMTAIPASIFSASPNLQLLLWFSDGTNGFAAVNPAQTLTPTPYAIFAESANTVVGVVPGGGLSGSYSGAVSLTNAGNSFTGNGTGLTNVNAATLGGLGANNFWQTTGNAGTTAGTNFVGTIDNQPLELHVNGQRALLLTPGASDSPNSAGGFAGNVIDAGVNGAVIAGGGTADFLGSPSTNRVSASYSSIGGGSGNSIQSGVTDHAVIAGGENNLIGMGSWQSVIGGGLNNAVQAPSPLSVIGGGNDNVIQTDSFGSTVAGGQNNTIQSGASYAFLGGGQLNTIGANAINSTIGGGLQNEIDTNDWGAVITGGHGNWIQAGSNGGGGGANSSYATISGGYQNVIGSDATHSAVDGGAFNTIQAGAFDSMIGGGYQNTVQTNAFNSMIGGGAFNTIQAGVIRSTIAGGFSNTNFGSYSTIGGGDNNTIQSFYAFIGGGIGNIVGINSDSSLISGGSDNVIADNNGNSFIGGGVLNTNGAPGSAIAGGQQNVVGPGAKFSFVGSGLLNNIQTNAVGGAIGGGQYNTIQGTATNATVGGGISNTVSGSYAMVPGGSQNSASGNYSFAAGNRARANADGCFVWADSQAADFTGSTANTFLVRCKGGVGFFSGTTGADQEVAWVPGTGAWSFVSDRNAKDRFTPVDTESVLDKISRLPLAEWSYRGYNQRHIGPMAQDWHAMFPLNDNDKMLNELDVQGVALAAIQGLNQKLEEQNKQKDAEITDLKVRLDKLEQLIASMKGDNK